MRKQNQTYDQKHSIPASYFVIRGKKVQTGILEHFCAILLFPQTLYLKKKKNPFLKFISSKSWPLEVIIQSTHNTPSRLLQKKGTTIELWMCSFLFLTAHRQS